MDHFVVFSPLDLVWEYDSCGTDIARDPPQGKGLIKSRNNWYEEIESQEPKNKDLFESYQQLTAAKNKFDVSFGQINGC